MQNDEDGRGQIRRQPARQFAQRFDPAGRRSDNDNVMT
jgi:hypothetical protein